MTRHNQFHLELTGWRIILIPFAVIAAIIVGSATKVAGLKGTADLTPTDVAGYLQNFIEGRGSDWDWDDFTSIPISDPALEEIRQQAAGIALPTDNVDHATLHRLLQKVRSLQQ